MTDTIRAAGTLTYGSLCTGYEGIALGLSLVEDLDIRWQAEVDPHASKILAARFPDVPNLGDIKTVDWIKVWEDTVMGAPRNDERADSMYARYLEGVSLAVVAHEFGCTRQSVYVIFKRRGFVLHARPAGRIFQFHNGVRHTLRNNGYYAATSGTREYIHRQIWMDANGSIPDGFDIHHRDHDKSHNELANFECISKEDHARLYGTGCNQHVHRNHPDCAEEVVPSDSPAVEILSAGYP